MLIGIVFTGSLMGLAPQTLDHEQHLKKNSISIRSLLYSVIHNHLKIRFALILLKLHEIC